MLNKEHLIYVSVWKWNKLVKRSALPYLLFTATGEGVLVGSSTSKRYSYLLIHLVSYRKLSFQWRTSSIVSKCSFSGVFLRPFSVENITMVLAWVVLQYFLHIYLYPVFLLPLGVIILNENWAQDWYSGVFWMECLDIFNMLHERQELGKKVHFISSIPSPHLSL